MLQTHAVDFPVLAHITHDVLAVPGVSISMEQLFLSSKRTLSDLYSAVTTESALKTVVAQEWLKKGLWERVDYPDDVCILTSLKLYYN